VVAIPKDYRITLKKKSALYFKGATDIEQEDGSIFGDRQIELRASIELTDEDCCHLLLQKIDQRIAMVLDVNFTNNLLPPGLSFVCKMDL
jgi:hypothetical protein